MAITKWKKEDRFDPWSDFNALQNEINELFDINRYPSTTGLFDRNVSPAMDVIEKEHEFRLISELPGFEKDDFEISIASNVLTIKGSKKQELEEKDSAKGKFYRKESWSGSFQRTFPLPASVDTNRIDAELKDGILNVVLPKKEEAIPKQISVNVK